MTLTYRSRRLGQMLLGCGVLLLAPLAARADSLTASLPPELAVLSEGAATQVHPSAYDAFTRPAKP